MGTNHAYPPHHLFARKNGREPQGENLYAPGQPTRPISYFARSLRLTEKPQERRSKHRPAGSQSKGQVALSRSDHPLASLAWHQSCRTLGAFSLHTLWQGRRRTLRGGQGSPPVEQPGRGCQACPSQSQTEKMAPQEKRPSLSGSQTVTFRS